MKATEELRHDHDVLRAKFVQLEEWLPVASSAPFTVQSLTRSIARLLRDHTEREGAFFSTLRDRLQQQPNAWRAQLFAEHEHQRRTVCALMELLLKCRDAPADQVVLCAFNAITGLREQMGEEEARLFPVLDQLLDETPMERLFAQLQAPQAPPGAQARRQELVPSADHSRLAITSDLTVEQILRVHPRAQAIFQAFDIDTDADQHRRLSDLGWRGALDVAAVTLALNQALGSDGEAPPMPHLLWDSSDGLLVIDGRRRILAMNPALGQLVGQQPAEVIGQRECGTVLGCQDERGCPLATHPERCPGLKAMRRRQPVVGAEYTIATSRGHTLPVSASYTPVQLTSGGAVWTLVSVRNHAVQKRRESRLVQRAMLDPLTGLLNRAGILKACANELARAGRHARPLAIAMADLDGLKAYNDAYGHAAGDGLLKTVASVLQIDRRATELVGRYGGDEFIVLMPETGTIGAVMVADRFRQAIAEFPVTRVDSRVAAALPVPVTLSVGVAVFPEDGPTLEALIGKADGRLYEAKRRGRNHMVGPVDCLERRGHPRVTMEAPIVLRTSSAAPSQRPAQEGRTKNVNLAGVYCLVPPWESIIRTGESMAFSLSVPTTQRSEFPYAQLLGHGRVVRIDELPKTRAGDKRVGLALKFGEDLTTLPKDPRRAQES